jgi:hypothetical protein
MNTVTVLKVMVMALTMSGTTAAAQSTADRKAPPGRPATGASQLGGALPGGSVVSAVRVIITSAPTANSPAW